MENLNIFFVQIGPKFSWLWKPDSVDYLLPMADVVWGQTRKLFHICLEVSKTNAPSQIIKNNNMYNINVYSATYLNLWNEIFWINFLVKFCLVHFLLTLRKFDPKLNCTWTLFFSCICVLSSTLLLIFPPTPLLSSPLVLWGSQIRSPSIANFGRYLKDPHCHFI